MISPPLKIEKLLRRANGSSEPWFCALDDGSTWLVKFVGAGPGPSALFAELVANSLGRAWGFPIPRARPVVLPIGVAKAGTDEFWDVLDASRGYNLGIEVIPGARDTVPSRDVLGANLSALVAFDTLMANWDRTELSRNLLTDAANKLWWIDHGSCRFLHNLDKPRPSALPKNHFFASVDRSNDRVDPPMLALDQLRNLLAEVPEQWRLGLGSQAEIATKLFCYLWPAVTGPGERK